MKLIPSGTFLMGDSNVNSPVHRAQIPAFLMDETPITYADFQTYVDDGGNVSRYWKYSSYNMPEQPVTGVSWYQAVNFCNWRSQREGLQPVYYAEGDYDAWGHEKWAVDYSANGYRLPTEAEWEYAARGGLVQQPYPLGAVFDASNANFDTDQGHKQSKWWRLATVYDQQVNAYGLYGMSGNVWEWCTDWYGADYYQDSPECQPKGPENGRTKIMRGGSWGSPGPTFLTTSYRSHAAPSNYNYDIGFRCVRPAETVGENAVEKEAFDFYTYPNASSDATAPDSAFFSSEAFKKRLARYLEDNFQNCLYFHRAIDEQPVVSPQELAELIVSESVAAKINPLFVTSIMVSESGMATVSFPRWWNNPMAYHWQNVLMSKGEPRYNADRNHNRKYRNLSAAIRNYARIRRSIYYERAQRDLYDFHLLYVGYEAEEWMYTIGKVFREVAALNIAPHEPTHDVGKFIYLDWPSTDREKMDK